MFFITKLNIKFYIHCIIFFLLKVKKNQSKKVIYYENKRAVRNFRQNEKEAR